MNSKVLAVCGKGGVGKTTVSAIAARAFWKSGLHKALIVDADHAAGLSLALGIEPRLTVNDIRSETIDRIKQGRKDPEDLALSADYLLGSALVEKGSLAFLSVGRPEEQGCFCSVHSLLRGAIESLSGLFDKTLIDAEAGIEQINRQVMRKIDYLFLVADPTIKAVRVARQILDVAGRSGDEFGFGLFINKAPSIEMAENLAKEADLPLVGVAPRDLTIEKFDLLQTPYFDLPETEAALAVEKALNGVGFL